MKLSRLFALALAISFSALAVPARAEDVAAVQRRVQERQPAVDALKRNGSVGENNAGLLEARSALAAPDQAVVDAENADRGALYAEVARRTQTSADNVGKVRAKKIAEMSTSGIWLQDETGKWYRK